MLVREVGKLDLYLWYKDWLFGRPIQLPYCKSVESVGYKTGWACLARWTRMIKRDGGWWIAMRRHCLYGTKRYQGTETIQENPTVYLKPSQGLGSNCFEPLMISAQCPECQSEEIQLSTGKRRE